MDASRLDTLDDAGAFHVHDRFADLFAVRSRKYEFSFSRAGRADFTIFVYVAVSVSSERDRFFPARNGRIDIVYEYGCAEHGAVEFRADDAVRTRSEVRKFVFFHARRVRRDRRAFDADAEPLDRFGRIVGYFIVGFVAFC